MGLHELHPLGVRDITSPSPGADPEVEEGGGGRDTDID